MMMDLSDDDFEVNARRATATIGNLRFQRARVTRRRGPKARVLSLKGMYYLPPSDAVMPMRNNRQKIWEHMADGYGYPVRDFNEDVMTPVSVKVPLDLTQEQFMAFVREKFRRLANVEFSLYTVNPGRVYIPLPAGFATPLYLKSLNVQGYKGILLIKEGNVEQLHLEQLPPLDLPIRHRQETPLKDILQGLSAQITDNDALLVDVTQTCLEAAVKAFFPEGNFHNAMFERKLDVKFHERGTAADMGGPTRQFCTFLTRELATSPIFAGPEINKTLVLNKRCFEQGLYKQYGALMAYLIAREGPMPNLLAPKCYERLLGHKVHYQIQDVPDPDLQVKLHQISNSSEQHYFERCMQMESLIFLTGTNDLIHNINNKDELVDTLTQALCGDSLDPAMAQFREGMATLGVLEACHKNPNTMAVCLVTALQPPLTKSTLLSQMEIHIDLHHIQSVAAHNCLMQLFEEYEEQGKLEIILMSITGCDKIPPGGFEKKIRTTFTPIRDNYNFLEDLQSSPIYFNTCEMELRVPMFTSFQTMKEVFDMVLPLATSFTNL